MILIFPSVDILQVALKSGIIPPEIATQPIHFSYAPDGRVFLEIHQSLPRNLLKRLAFMEVRRGTHRPPHEFVAAHCWYQIIPLQKCPLPEGGVGENLGNVIFEVNDQETLRNLVEEILRLGNDRMSLLCYKSSKNEDFLALLHVKRPPYYTLLRSLEYDIVSKQKSLYAYYEQLPRCWVEIGWSHPLAHCFTIPENHRLFIRSPYFWRFFDDAPFQDIYQSLDVQIPIQHCPWQALEQVPKLSVPLRLTVDSRRVEPSLWLISGDRQLDFEEWLRGTNEKILERLSFAVAESPEHEKWIVLYAETGRDATSPPVLDLEIALPYAPHPLVQNIYLPLGYTLHPQLRAETLQKLFLIDHNQLVLIYPIDHQKFRPYTLSLDSFRRMSDWINYLLSQHHTVLQEWIDATTFDWTLSIQEVLSTDDHGTPPNTPTELSAHEGATVQADHASKKEDPQIPHRRGRQRTTQKRNNDSITEIPRRESLSPETSSPSEASLRDLEQRFLQIPGCRLDDPQRLQLWLELAQAYSEAGKMDQAALCWLHALWHCEPAELLPRVQGWFYAQWEGLSVPSVKSWKRVLEITDNRLVGGLAAQRVLASFAYWILRYPDYCTGEFLQEFQQFLERNQELLPLRGLWIGYSLLSRRLNDPLLLHRVADRLLENLMHNPSVSLRDLPRFLHGGSMQYQHTLQVLRGRLSELLVDVLRWINISTSDNTIKVQEPYVYYFFAYLAARLGMNDNTEKWLNQAERSLNILFSKVNHKVAKLCVSIIDRSYRHRIYEVINKLPRSPQLPKDIHEDIDRLSEECQRSNSRLAYYSITRLLQKSELLEPLLKKDAISIWLEKHLNVDSSNIKNSDDLSIKDYLQMLRQLLIQLFSQKVSKISKLWSEFADSLQKVLVLFPPHNNSDSRKTWSRQLISELTTIYSSAFRISSIYGQQSWIEHLANILDEHLQKLSNINRGGVSFDVMLMNELVPTAIFIERICHNSNMINYISQKLSNWINLSDEMLQNRDCTPEDIMLSHINATIAYLSTRNNHDHDNLLEKLHQEVLGYRLKNHNQRVFVRIAINYIKCICYLSNISSIEYVHKFFKDCIEMKISINNSWSSSEYFSLDHLQIMESLVYLLDNLLFSDSAISHESTDTKTDLQIENEYILHRKIINDIRVLTG